jgi:hypothetical protein
MRGKKDGLLKRLVDRNVITPDVERTASELYAQLNGAIHSSEQRMIHAGLGAGRWAGLQFKLDQYRLWCDDVVRVAVHKPARCYIGADAFSNIERINLAFTHSHFLKS